MTNIVGQDLLRKCIDTFRATRTKLLEAAAMLHLIKENGSWEGQFSSYSEFVEGGCGLSLGQASKLLQVYEFYVIREGISATELEKVDPERLYLALKLPQGTARARLSSALTLSRQELRQEVADKDTEHQHEPITICAKCGKRL